MQQSEIYAHFMAKKIGVAEDKKKDSNADESDDDKRGKKHKKKEKGAKNKYGACWS